MLRSLPLLAFATLLAVGCAGPEKRHVITPQPLPKRTADPGKPLWSAKGCGGAELVPGYGFTYFSAAQVTVYDDQGNPEIVYDEKRDGPIDSRRLAEMINRIDRKKDK